MTIALDELSKDYPIDIPPYFALILRAFSVIEGTALRVDPDYAIVKETFPYLSRRLLTDNQPRARAALRQLLYGVWPAPCLCTFANQIHLFGHVHRLSGLPIMLQLAFNSSRNKVSLDVVWLLSSAY